MGARYLTEEQKAHFREARNKTMLERYGKKSTTDVEKVKASKLNKYGDENYNNQEKHRQTCLERFGVEHHNKHPDIQQKISYSKSQRATQDKYEATMLAKYGCKSPNMVPHIREKYTQTLLKNYGVTSPLKNKDIWQKHIDTMKLNNSFSKSQPEEYIYNELLKTYSKDDIERQYSDERYPFNCDFYIKSKDLFIEVNFHPSHGGHPFNASSEDDLKLLEQLKSENTRWSNMIIDVWTNRDVIKIEVNFLLGCGK